MAANGDLWQGIIRWKQTREALKLKSDLSAKIDHAVSSSQEESSASKLHNDLLEVDKKSAHHLALPAKKERLIMGKLKLVGLILLFLLAGALFFVAGFLTCYTVFPPSQTSFSTNLPGGGPYGASRPSEGLGTTPSSQIVSPTTSYAARQSMLRGGKGNKGSLLEQAESQTAYQAKLQAHNIITRTLNRWSMKLRSVFGYYAGSAIAPLTTGLAKRVADSALPLDRPGVGFGGGKSSTGSSSGGDAPQAAAQSGSAGTHTIGGGKASSPGRFTILVQSFSNSGDAFKLSGELQSHGFGAYVAQEQSGSGVKFSVKVGQFSNFTDARDASAVLSQQWHRPARVVMIDPSVGH